MASFDRKNGSVRVRLDQFERDLLRQLVAEMRVLLEADLPREDVVTARLFPQAYLDPDDQEHYEEMLHDDLRRTKLAALRDVEDVVDGEGKLKTELSPEQVEMWLAVLTDLRLAIGTRLDVTEEKMETEHDEDDAEAPAYAALHWLGWMQESILKVVNP